jgi:YihY family inner membrane protein
MRNDFMGRLDAMQRRRRVIGFPYAVIKRYTEDHGPWIGSLISYYGFFSLYPALVVFVSVSTLLFKDRPDALQRILEAVWSKLPFADSASTQAEVQKRVSDFSANRWVLVLSLLITLWGGLGVVRVLQDGVNTIWGVARFRRPGIVRKVVRALAIIGLLALDLIGTTVVAGVSVAAGLPWGGVVVVALATIALSVGIALAVYRLAIATPVETRELLPGAFIIAIGTYIVTLIGGIYVKNVVARMSGLYGPFASTIGLLAYVSVIVQVFVIGTEVNVVIAKQLWPRSLSGVLHEPDQRAMQLTMSREALASPDVFNTSRKPTGD